MQEFPDDSLDELFRKSAEEFAPDFEARAWAAMRKKLDTNEGTQKRPVVVPVLLLLLLLSSLSVGGYLLWPRLTGLVSKNSTDTSTVTPQTASKHPKTGNQNEAVLAPKNTSNNLTQNVLSPQTELKQSETEQTKAASPTAISENTENISEKAPSSASNPAPATHTKDVITTIKKTISSKSLSSLSTTADKTDRSKVKSAQKVRGAQPDLSRTPSATLSKKRASFNNELTTDRLPGNVADKRAKDGFSGPSDTKNGLITTDQNRPLSPRRSAAYTPASEKSTPPNSAILADNNGQSTEITAKPISTPNKLAIHPLKQLSVAYARIEMSYTAPPPPLAIVKKPETEASPVFKKGLSIRILAAPDLSFIGFDQMKRPGGTFGALLEYRFSRRFSVQAGAVRSMKLYDALGSQYVWPERWNTQKARPVNIEASCKVLDIPINLRFDITQAADRRWFVSAGISSYKMLNEKYIYTYAPHTYGIKWYTWEGSTGDYWLGVLNVSMGFERQLGKRFTLQAEPYFKVPLAQVGLGQIKLNTAGIYISTRYRFGRF
ncbi:hypothetical protein [Runella slithyformis]|nr:hypothetical protein [Runella slithyformis]